MAAYKEAVTLWELRHLSVLFLWQPFQYIIHSQTILYRTNALRGIELCVCVLLSQSDESLFKLTL